MFGRLNSVSSGIAGVIETLRSQLGILEQGTAVCLFTSCCLVVTFCVCSFCLVTAGAYILLCTPSPPPSLPAFSSRQPTEIKADKKGQQDYRKELRKLQIRKEDAHARLDANDKLAATFDVQFGPFMEKYDALTKDISTLYDSAKAEHVKGIDLLVREFKYNPLFKKPSDTFSAVPFKPK